MGKIKVVKLPHGWFRGEMKEKDVIDTIDASVMNWHILLVEYTNKLIEREREFLSKAVRRWVTQWQVMVMA